MDRLAADWIGVRREAREVITARQEKEFRATFDGVLGDDAPLVGIHWCLAPEIYPPADLGRDAHPKTGLFLPDLGLPRRMWAGGSIAYTAPLAVGDTVTRKTVVRDVKFKKGKSGELGFVTLTHEYFRDDALMIGEDHTIVYRDDPAPDTKPPQAPKAEVWKPIKTLEILPTTTLLFRYSAMTFNGHRIHYDHEYATKTEGYGGLVVHGPLQSTWMQIMATALLGRPPKEFSYRGLSPLICGRRIAVEAVESDDGLSLRVRDLAADVVTMTATAR